MDLGKFLDFDYEKYEFARCESCYCPLFGSEAENSFEVWLKRVPGFRESRV